MSHVPVSEFEARCAAVLDDVERTGRSVTITRRDKSVAGITLRHPTSADAWLAAMAGVIGLVLPTRDAKRSAGRLVRTPGGV